MLNVEFKAELRDPEIARAALASIGAKLADEMRQIDTYYRIPAGRLKKRDVPGEPAEYLAYHRADRTQPKLSQYQSLDADQFLARYGERPLPVLVTVTKQRELHMLGTIRVHLDEVEHLGTFLEFEAPVSPAQNVAKCHAIIADLRKRLGPSLGEPISVSYCDLLLGERTE